MVTRTESDQYLLKNAAIKAFLARGTNKNFCAISIAIYAPIGEIWLTTFMVSMK